ncbi:MAG: hypothetical protein K0S72_1556 [Arthrobacter sp.]|nr:hypothetical protein [Arthrobacter sp.]
MRPLWAAPQAQPPVGLLWAVPQQVQVPPVWGLPRLPVWGWRRPSPVSQQAGLASLGPVCPPFRMHFAGLRRPESQPPFPTQAGRRLARASHRPGRGPQRPGQRGRGCRREQSAKWGLRPRPAGVRRVAVPWHQRLRGALLSVVSLPGNSKTACSGGGLQRGACCSPADSWLTPEPFRAAGRAGGRLLGGEAKAGETPGGLPASPWISA